MVPEDPQLLVSLTDSSVPKDRVSPSRVGGKASSLARLFATEGLAAHVPKAHALTVDFFAPWIEELRRTKDFVALSKLLDSDNDIASFASGETQKNATALCEKLRTASKKLKASNDQFLTIGELARVLNTTQTRLAAVRSSAPEEDGTGASFAGAFATVLGVATTEYDLSEAIKECFASLWDYRVLRYKQEQKKDTHQNIGFALVVMEMVDSAIAGVAFSANPINSDRDELVIDSSWGLGESVVDGSVTADRYLVDKILNEPNSNYTIIEESLGTKGVEKRLDGSKGSGVVEREIEETNPKYSASSLTHEQIGEVARLVCLVEETYGMPMDVEWAFVETTPDQFEAKLLQARPITTLYSVDKEMMTEPGQQRRLYWDVNVVSEATTTKPFTTMDMDFYNKAAIALCGISFAESDEKQIAIYSTTDPDQPMYCGKSRQYANAGLVMKYMKKDRLSKSTELMDPYMSSIIRSNDFDPAKYKTKHWIPKGVTFRETWKFFNTFPTWTLYKTSKKYADDPKGSVEAYRKIVRANMEKLESVSEAGKKSKKDEDQIASLKQISSDLCDSIIPSLLEEIGAIMGSALKTLKDADEERRNGATEAIRKDAEALCGGFEGDELMEMNIALYKLARLLPEDIWDEYGAGGRKSMKELAARIKADKEGDLPGKFVSAWKAFLARYGWDGQDQMFISCPRYNDSPERLLVKLKLNSKGDVKDPSIAAKENVEKRRAVMARQEAEAKEKAAAESIWASFWSSSEKKKLATLKKRNDMLEHVLWMRNAPKLHLTRVIGMIREHVLELEEDMIAKGLLENPGDIFHLTVKEVDLALKSAQGDDESEEIDLIKVVRPRRAHYKRAVEVSKTVCPILVDSRCRILRPDPPSSTSEPGTLLGAAMSPGVATGKVRIVHSPSENSFESGEVLCAIVTGPAWTPLFACASAVVLQIGGVLQHGALCAREYGKPAVSNIDVIGLLKDGMTVSVDGSTGVVKILDEGKGDGGDLPQTATC